jgi:nicotinate phosphoribosyltransferase
MKSDFIDFLRCFKFNPNYVTIDTKNGFDLRIKGPWLHTILFEVPVLAIVNEVYFKRTSNYKECEAEGMKRLREKVKLLDASPYDFKFAEFGTRRRYSMPWQQQVLWNNQYLKNRCVGTSNVMFAKQFNMKPIGTMAHEWIQAGQAMDVRLVHSQKFMLDAWMKEYRGDLGIALTDTISLDVFLKEFDLFFAKLFDGLRHDSGCPYTFGEKVIARYKELGIDPKTKTAVWTDSLDIPKAIDIHNQFIGRIKTSFGIGTNLTNDLGPEPINIVIKMVRCNNQPVAKLSDNPKKNMCEDQKYVEYLKSVFGVK